MSKILVATVAETSTSLSVASIDQVFNTISVERSVTAKNPKPLPLAYSPKFIV